MTVADPDVILVPWPQALAVAHELMRHLGYRGPVEGYPLRVIPHRAWRSQQTFWFYELTNAEARAGFMLCEGVPTFWFIYDDCRLGDVLHEVAHWLCWWRRCTWHEALQQVAALASVDGTQISMKGHEAEHAD